MSNGHSTSFAVSLSGGGGSSYGRRHSYRHTLARRKAFWEETEQKVRKAETAKPDLVSVQPKEPQAN